MRKLLFILALFPSLAIAGGPKYTYPTVQGLDDEMNNAYHDIRNVPNGIYASSSMTLQGLTVDSITINSGFTNNAFAAAIQAVDGTPKSTTSTTFVNTALTASITPKSTSHRVKITITATYAAPGNDIAYFNILRNNTTSLSSSSDGFVGGQVAVTTIVAPLAIVFIDSPATTSSTSYTLYIKSKTGQSVSYDPTGVTSVIVLEEIL